MLQDKHQHQYGQYGAKSAGNTWSPMAYHHQQRQTQPQSNTWENESLEKSAYKKTLKRKSPTYYAPANTVNRNSFNKYFAGNGKPKGFYVIKENQKKPTMFKHIIA